MSERQSSMQVRDLMIRSVISVRPETSLREAISILVDNRFAALPVVDGDGLVVGVLSESNALAVGPDQQDASVGSTMSTPAEVISPGSDVSTAAVRMLNGRLRSLPVVEQGLLIGIVARRDLLRVLINDDVTIAAKIRSLLDDYAGSRRQWTIASNEGKIEICGGFSSKDEQRIVAALARTVPGVRHVDVLPTAVAPAVGI
ncbi:CBS domain-containing protein [Antrihabitans sp. YC3-6]|uniref:CBS domain-containing protein n=2 Tax=Antrihabitans stalagmiti TaxID=2799499 RepID=A0A934U578_9NOCA|nr:CBS domain-containing protein [Antrihabitans stalagmiti]